MATPKAPLRAVQDDEKAERKAPRSVHEAAQGGDRRELLVAMRSRIAKDIDDPNTPARDLAALSRRLLEIAKEIEAIDAKSGEDPVGTAASTPDEDWEAI